MAEPPGHAAKDSAVRDHLANERTYLAWLRTSANVMVLGLAVAKFVETGDPRSLAAGVLLVAVGAVGVVYSAMRYRSAARGIDQGRIDVGGQTTGPLAAGAVLIVAVAAALILLAW